MDYNRIIYKKPNKTGGYFDNISGGKAGSDYFKKGNMLSENMKRLQGTDINTGNLNTGAAVSDVMGGVTSGVTKGIDSTLPSTLPSAVTNTAETAATNPSVGMGTVTKSVSMGAEALDRVSDNDERTYTGGEKAADIGASALKGASAGTSTGMALAGASGTIGTIMGSMGTVSALGSTIPIVGTVAGLVVGGIIGGIKARKAKRAAKREKARSVRVETNKEIQEQKDDLSQQDKSIITAPLSTTQGQVPYEQKNKSLYRFQQGGTLARVLVIKKATIKKEPIKKVKASPENPIVFKRGGKVKATENIIPNGVLHEEKNKLGDKGMPVVKCKSGACTKKYEIEKDEMIFTLDTTKKVEDLVDKKEYAELGKFVKDQVLGNTHSFTDKFNYLNGYKKENETIYS